MITHDEINLNQAKSLLEADVRNRGDTPIT
jgi:urease beta subunit